MKKWVVLILAVVLSMATVVPVKALDADSINEIQQKIDELTKRAEELNERAEELSERRKALGIIEYYKKGQRSIKLNRSKIAPTIKNGAPITIFNENRTSVFINAEAIESAGIKGDKTVEIKIKDQPLNKLSRNVREGLKEYNDYTVLAFTDIEIKNGTQIIESIEAPIEVAFEFLDLGLTEEDFENIVCLSIDKDGVAAEIDAKLGSSRAVIFFDIYNFDSVGLIQLNK